MIKISSVRGLDNYQLECVFQDGRVISYDMSYVLHTDTPMLKPLRDPVFFKSVFLDSGAPVWPNGYDLCPDAIWKKTLGKDYSTSMGTGG